MENATFGNETIIADWANSYDESLQYVRNPYIQACVWALYGLMSLLSVSGNMIVILVISLNERLRTGSNMMVLSLALADIVYCASGMIFTPLSLVAEAWFAGELLCKLIPMFAGVSVHVISLTTMAIAIDRNLRTTTAKRCSLHTQSLVIVDLCIWAAASAFSIPIGLHTRMENGRCVESWDNLEPLRRSYTYFCLTMQFVVPAVVITFCYIRMMRFFKERYIVALSRSFVAERRRMLNELNRKKSISKLSMAIIVSFIIFFIPLNTFNLVADYYVELVDNSRYAILFYIFAHLVTSASTVVNPILYGCFNTTFQRFLKRSRLFSNFFHTFETSSNVLHNTLNP